MSRYVKENDAISYAMTFYQAQPAVPHCALACLRCCLALLGYRQEWRPVFETLKKRFVNISPEKIAQASTLTATFAGFS
jgi:hypothetical protein